jgi:hypothetical protein
MSDSSDTLPHRGLAHGVSVFGGIILATVGLFQFFEGLSAVSKDKVYASTPQYVYEFDLTVWGWFHLVVGALAVAAGIAIVVGQPWAFFAGIFLATLSALTQFLFMPYYPLWALTIIAVDVAVIWALCTRLREDWSTP